MRQPITTTCSVFLLLFVVGCGPDDGRVRVYPVDGKVLVGGEPAAGARVVFYPTTTPEPGIKYPTPAATTDSTGHFELTSYESGDGAPAGSFKVTVVWPEPPPPNATGEFNLKDRLRGKYSKPDKTELTAMVEEGGGTIPPFEL